MPQPPPVRYRSPDEDSARWLDFEFRAGDIVISTRSKSGTTWVQMICALLVFGSAELPAPLGELSPWLDWLVTPQDELFARLAAQEHRRIIKTHTPLDGIVLSPLATYIVVARDPLDAAVSLYHQGANLNRERLSQLTGSPVPPADQPRPELEPWLRGWIGWDPDPREAMDSLPGVMAHLSDAWARRGEDNIVLVHYDDLHADLEGQMRRLADAVHVPVADEAWPALVEAAGFEPMAAAAAQRVPDPSGVLLDQSRFFRRGTSGEGREVLSDADVAQFRARVSSMAPPDLVSWLLRAE